ncbi:MAG: heparinase II/III domain-containing protein [Pseudomonadota bacterium]
MENKQASWSYLVNRATISSIPENVFFNLERHASKYIGMSFNELANQPKWPRIFIWHNYILETFLYGHLVNDNTYKGKVVSDVASLNKLNDNGYGMFSSYEPHGPAFLVISLCICVEAFSDSIEKKDKDLFLDVVEFYCDRISKDQVDSAWGDEKASRLMWNHSIVGYAGLYFGGAILEKYRGEDKYKKWYALGKSKVFGFFTHGITRCGVNREGISYSGMTLKAAMPCVLQELMLGGELPSEIYSRLCSYVQYFAYEVVPRGGSVWNYNDSYMDPRLGINGLLMASFVSGKSTLGNAVWHATVGDYGAKNYSSDKKLWRSSLFEACLFLLNASSISLSSIGLPSRKYFPEKGYFSMRSSWSSDAFAFTFSCGEGVERIHQQSDHNSFTLAVNGQPLIIDSGPSNAKNNDSPSQTVGHQGIIIDGIGMALCGGKDSTSGEVLDYWESGGCSFISGNAAKAYNKKKYNPLEKAIRNVWVLDDKFPFVVINDQYFVGDKVSHFFEWVMHIRNDMDLVEDRSKKAVGFNKYRLINNNAPLCINPELDIYFVFPKPESFSFDAFENAKAYDDELVVNHKIARFKKAAVDGLFWVVLVPYKEGLELKEARPEINKDSASIDIVFSTGEESASYKLSTLKKDFYVFD